MLEFLGDLGIDWKLLIAQVVNFGLLLWLLAKFMYKPVIRRIEKDEAELQQVQKQKVELEKEMHIFEEQKKKEISEAKERAREIVAEAEGVAKEIRKRAQEEAEQEKQAVIKQIHLRLKAIEHDQENKSSEK